MKHTLAIGVTVFLCSFIVGEAKAERIIVYPGGYHETTSQQYGRQMGERLAALAIKSGASRSVIGKSRYTLDTIHAIQNLEMRRSQESIQKIADSIARLSEDRQSVEAAIIYIKLCDEDAAGCEEAIVHQDANVDFRIPVKFSEI